MIANNTEPDPNLVAAREEMTAIMRRRNIAGLIILSGPNSGEFNWELGADWSCARFETQKDGGWGIRFRVRAQDIPEAATRRRLMEQTLGMLLWQRGRLEMLKEQHDQVLAQLTKIYDVEHWERRAD